MTIHAQAPTRSARSTGWVPFALVALVSVPANAERLLRSIADAEAGRTEIQELIDPRHDVA